jgi:hypothetical protein
MATSFAHAEFYIVCVASSGHPRMDRLIESVQRQKLPIHVLGMGKQWIGPGMKLVCMDEYVDYLQDEDVVMFVDAWDVLVMADKEEILEKYKSFNKPIVVSAEKNIWPYRNLASFFPETKSAFKYINTGGYIARAKELKQFFHQNRPVWGFYDDQAFFQIAFLNDPSMFAIDYDAKIFMTLFQVEDDEVDFHPVTKRLVYKASGNQPCAIHANGHTYRILDKLYDLNFAK